MEDFDELAEKLSDKSLFWCFCFGALSVFAVGIILFGMLFVVYNWTDLLSLFGLICSSDEPAECASNNNVYENRIFVIVAFITLLLTLWGRWLMQKQTKQTQKQIGQTQKQIKLSKEANASERYENAARMLGDNVLAVRIGGCHALRNLGVGNKDIALQCIQLLLSFINNPDYSEKELENIEWLWNQGNFQEYSAIYEVIKADAQASIDSFSTICKHYYDNGEALKLGVIHLPNHVWKDENKSRIYLPNSIIVSGVLEEAYLRKANFENSDLEVINLKEANLWGINLQKANLIQANLQKANLGNANLKEANLWIADLRGAILLSADLLDANMGDADLSEAEMQTAKNLTKEQILSAKWGYSKEGIQHYIEPPRLPEDLRQDKDIKKWLEKPRYAKNE